MGTNGSGEFVDYYALLGVEPTAEIAEIRRAYIWKAKQHHPDAGGTDAVMQQLNVAYRTLTSSTKKAAYDMLHNFHTGATKPGDYRYHKGREVNDVSDMSDEEIDAFLDNLLTEYDPPAKNKQNIGQKFKQYFKKG